MVYFGCRNEKFGGCGTVFHVHSMSIPNHRPIQIHEGYQRSQAILMLRQFYLNENSRAPVPKKKGKRILKTEDLCE
ncbi:tRNA(adenine34) deaminase [Coelomomyces lativittatus]|nr:tRNA(adenine34) deaminase [Coelomomyces lativittatus]